MSGNICIIPARGRSKRIPRKNIKDFCGKPIIVYAIELAKSSNLFDEIMVSTDDTEIALLSTGDSTIVHDGVCECSGDSVLKAQDLSRWRKYT